MKRRLLGILLAACMAVSGPAAVFAAEDLAGGEVTANEVSTEKGLSINGFDTPYLDPCAPAHNLYGTEEKPVGSGERGDSQDIPSVEVTDTEEFCAAFRNYMLQRQSPFKIIISTEIPMENAQDEFYAFNNEIQRIADEEVVAHTGDPCEGDYLRYHRGGYNPEVDNDSIILVPNGTTYTATWAIKYELDYYSTADQEQAVTERLGEVMSELDLDGKSDYEKVKTIHDFICLNTTYDYEHFGIDSYVTQFSAYGALVDGRSVCQGYANLFYRMCLEAGVDARIVGGTADNGEGAGPHAWNIVKIGDKYYFVDVTWDDPTVEGNPDYFCHDYFLVGWDTFGEDHALDEEYMTDEFAETYLISDTDYEPSYYDNYSDDVPSFVKASLLLGGQIGVNFFLKLPEIAGCDYDDSYMEFIVNGDAEKAEIDSYDPEARNSDGRLFGFTCHVNAIQMADPIKAVFHYTVNGTEETIALEDYTVEDYIVSLENAEGIGPEAVDLARALGNYGYHTQQYLSDFRGWSLGGEDPEHLPVTCNTTYDYSADRIQEIINALPVGELIWNKSSDIKNITFALALDSETSIQVYFKPVEGYTGVFTAGVNYSEPETIKRSNGRYRVSVPGISANKLGEPYTITVTTAAGETQLWVSALDYVGLCLKNSQNQMEKNAMAAIYEYYQAACAYSRTLPVPS